MNRKDSEFKGDLGPILEIDAKQVTDAGEFEGYASVFGEKDQGDDIAVAGCYSDSLARRGPEGIKLLWQHRPDTPIGKWLELREDAKGLYARGKLFLGIQKGRETHELMREGAIDGLSIGYRTLEDMFDRETGVRRLIKLDLREISVVTFPMLESATVSLVKGNQLPTERQFEQFLMRDAGFSAQQAKAIIANGFKSLKGQRDATGSEEETIILDGLSKLAQSMRG